MKGCCPPPGCEIFNERTARRDARRYRKRGLDPNARRLVDFLRQRGVQGATVLEIGGGVGALEIELLKAGAERALNVELSPVYESFERDLAAEAGVSDRLETRVLDFAGHPSAVQPADVVVMHRVVCCYPDMAGLVRPAAARAQRYLALTYPQDRWYTRLGVRCVNVAMRILKREFRTYVHSPSEILRAASGQGLRQVFRHDGTIWQQAAFERA